MRVYRYSEQLKLDALAGQNRQEHRTSRARSRSRALDAAGHRYKKANNMASGSKKKVRSSDKWPVPLEETESEGLKRLEHENATLRKENEQLKMDREILKKAAARSTGQRNASSKASAGVR